jgi:hypothetical protein
MAKVFLDIVSDLGPVNDLDSGIKKVAVTAKKSGEDQKKAFQEAGKAAKGYNDVVNDPKPEQNLKKQKSAVQQLKDEIKKYESEAIKAGEGTKEFARNIALAGQKKADLKDLKEAITALDPDSVAKAFLGLGTSAAGAFALAQSGAALLGEKNEDLEKSLLKVQAAQGLLAGLQQLANTSDELAKVKIIGLQKIQLLSTNLQTAAESKNIVVRNAAIAAQAALNAVTSLGFGGVLLLVGGIATLVAGLSTLITTNETAAESQERLKKEIEQTREITDALIVTNDAYIALREEQGAKESELDKLRNASFQLRKKQINDEINANKQAREAFKKELNDQIEEQKDFDTKDLRLKIKSTQDKIKAIEDEGFLLALKLNENSIKFDTETARIENDRKKRVEDEKKKSQADAERAAQERLANLKKSYDKEVALNDITLKMQEALLKKSLSNNEITQEQYEAGLLLAKTNSLNKQLSTISQFSKKGLDLGNAAAEKEIEIINTTAQAKIDGDKKSLDFKEKVNDKIKELEKSRADFLVTLGADEFEVKKNKNEAERDLLLKNLEEEKALKIKQAEETGASIAEIEAKYAKDKEAINEEFNKRQFDLEKARKDFEKKTQEEKNQLLLSSTQSILNDLAVIFADSFEAQKAIAIAGTLISTYESAQKAFAALAGIPVVGPALGGIAAAAAIAAGIARVNKIQEQQPPKKFYAGGYTGDGGKYEAAGEVHKGEYVHTQEKTKKYRNLFEAIHTDDFSSLKLIDLAPLLQGTGVDIRPDVAENINNMHSQYSEQKSKREGVLESEIKAMKKDMNRFFKYYKGKPSESNLPDGTKIVKIGSTTRIIKKKK